MVSNGLITVFSLNFTTAGKGPFMDGKAKNMCQRRSFLGGWGQWGEGHQMASISLGNLGAKFSETSFLHFLTYFTLISSYL